MGQRELWRAQLVMPSSVVLGEGGVSGVVPVARMRGAKDVGRWWLTGHIA